MAFWGHGWRFGWPFGTRGVPAEVPRIEILSQKSNFSDKKIGLGAGMEKTWKIESILSEKGEVLKRLNPPRCFVYRHSGVFHIFSKK